MHTRERSLVSTSYSRVVGIIYYSRVVIYELVIYIILLECADH